MFTYFKCRSMTISKVYHQCLNELSYKIVGTYFDPLYIVTVNPENQNSEILANTSEGGA